MTEPRIVDAEVVEMPKPERPELWAALYRPVERSWMLSGLAESLDKLKVACYTATLPWVAVKIPGTAPAPATATDGGLRRAAGYLETAEKHIRSEQWNVVAVAVASAAAELAKIRGGR